MIGSDKHIFGNCVVVGPHVDMVGDWWEGEPTLGVLKQNMGGGSDASQMRRI